MELLTAELKKQLQSQDPYHPSGPGRELDSDELIVYGKWFTPDSNWTWYAVSCSEDPDTGDVQFFGLVDGTFVELGYFWLSELEKARGPQGYKVERDIHWKPIPLSEVEASVDKVRT